MKVGAVCYLLYNNNIIIMLSLWGHYIEQAENIPLIIEVDWNIFQILHLHAKHILVFQSDWKELRELTHLVFLIDMM